MVAESRLDTVFQLNEAGKYRTAMSTIVFDTHAFVKELTQVGMPEEQAEVPARSQATLIDEQPATKRDLQELEARLRRDMKEMEFRLTHTLTLRLGSMLVVEVGVVAALVKLP